jgi:hypothetical protein
MMAGIVAGCSTSRESGLSDQALLGDWECGPTTMHGTSFDLVITVRTTNRPDHTYTSLTTSVITPHGKSPVTNKDQAHGTWRLDGDMITSTVQQVEFLSSSDPTFRKELGQKIQDDQLGKKSTYQSRILEFDGHVTRSIPVNSLYKEAVVESSCRRV